MTRRRTTVLQPAAVSFHLSLAGAWTAAMLQRLDLARAATSALEPKTFEAFGAGMATILAFHLVLSHTREVTRRAPWVARSIRFFPSFFFRQFWFRPLRGRNIYDVLGAAEPSTSYIFGGELDLNLS